MTQADHASLQDRQDVVAPVPRLGLQRRRLGPGGGQHARRLVEDERRLPGRGARGRGCASRCSTASTPSTATTTCSARWSSRTTSAWAARAMRTWSKQVGARHGRGGARHRHPLDLRPVRHRAAGRPLGPHLRGLLGGSGARQPSWARPRSAAARARTWRPARRAGLCQALRRRRWHDAGARASAEPDDGRALAARPGRHAGRRERRCATLHLRGYVPAIDAGVGSIMPSYSSWNGVKCTGSKFAAHRRAQAASWASRAS